MNNPKVDQIGDHLFETFWSLVIADGLWQSIVVSSVHFSINKLTHLFSLIRPRVLMLMEQVLNVELKFLIHHIGDLG